MKDYALKINVLVGDLERGVLPHPTVDDDGSDDGGLEVFGSGSGSGSDSDGGLLHW
jgi:hypothetical protein